MTPTGKMEVIYEVECSPDPTVVEAFDAWLPGHVREVLACEGFTGAEIQVPVEGTDGQLLRRTQYRVESLAALERYLEQDAPRLRAEAIARFGDRLNFSRRVLAPRTVGSGLPEQPCACRNCGAAVTGRYCAACGQSRAVHVLSLREVLGDVTHSVLHLDSRVWRTLRSLVLKPGQLTNEFIAGRHQLYLPPFRLYLVVSVLYFALSALLPEGQLLHVDAQGETVIAYGHPSPEADAAKARQELSRALDEAAGAADAPEALRRAAGLAATAVEGKDARAQCSVSLDLPVLRGLTPLLQEACRKVVADSGQRLGAVFLDTAPKLMFAFLPLMAAVAMLFYWRPRRLYAEHLVLFLHVHAFVFLWLALTSVINAVATLEIPFVGLLGVVGLLMMAYLPWYVLRAMRVVYGESRPRTAAKFMAVSLLYFVLLGITMTVGVIYSMLSL